MRRRFHASFPRACEDLSDVGPSESGVGAWLSPVQGPVGSFHGPCLFGLEDLFPPQQLQVVTCPGEQKGTHCEQGDKLL